MLRGFDEFGNLAYTFIETVEFLHTPYVWRAIGGACFLLGFLTMVYNIIMTITAARREEAALEAKLAAKLART
jgi:cytochrome c oxidase cbb3-type subunit 1